MATVLERGARYEPMIRERFEAEGLPGDLFYLALIESGYSSEAVSRAYAVGMWQFMRRTGRGYGLRVDTWVDERRDPVKATDAAARHLRDLRKRFGSLYLAAAAYNAGAGKVSRRLGQAGVGRARTTRRPPSTATPRSSGWPTPTPRDRDPGLRPQADRRGDHRQAAGAVRHRRPRRSSGSPTTRWSSPTRPASTWWPRLADVGLGEIRDLNPQYLRLATPPTHSVGDPAARRAPAPTSPRATRQLSRERAGPLPDPCRAEARAPVHDRGPLPDSGERSSAPSTPSRAPRPRAGTRLVIPTVAIPSALAMRATGERRPHHSASWRTHRVRRGETLSGIAQRYRVSLKALRRANSIRNEHALLAGTRLRIPG